MQTGVNGEQAGFLLFCARAADWRRLLVRCEGVRLCARIEPAGRERCETARAMLVSLVACRVAPRSAVASVPGRECTVRSVTVVSRVYSSHIVVYLWYHVRILFHLCSIPRPLQVCRLRSGCARALSNLPGTII